MWIRLNTSILGYDEPIFIGVWYIPPKDTTGIFNTHTMCNLLTEISNFSYKGNVLLLEVMSYCWMILMHKFQYHVNRLLKGYGRELLEISKAHNLEILNGRLGDDRNTQDTLHALLLPMDVVWLIMS